MAARKLRGAIGEAAVIRDQTGRRALLDEGPPALRRGHVQQAGAVAGQARVAGEAGPSRLPAHVPEGGSARAAGGRGGGSGGAPGAQATQEAAVGGGLDVKDDKPGHLYRHRWVVRRGSHSAKLTLSRHRKVQGLAMPYVWVQGSPALV